MSTDDQCTKWHRNIAENFNRLSRVHQRYRQQTDDRRTDGRTTRYSEFTFANSANGCGIMFVNKLMTSDLTGFAVSVSVKDSSCYCWIIYKFSNFLKTQYLSVVIFTYILSVK